MNKREDRLSSLHDDILVEILSRLPLQLAMSTGCLSWRWRDLWTNVTSIHIESNKFDYSRDLDDSTFDDIITRIKSPFIQSFSMDLGDVLHMLHYVGYPEPILNYSWLRQICDRNLRQLKLTNTSYCDGWIQSWFLPSFICVTRSLVSIELDSTLELQLPDNDDQINLPNLNKLHLYSTGMNLESLEKLIKACPSLEELCFTYKSFSNPFEHDWDQINLPKIKFSHQKLQRLFIKNLPYKYRVVLNAPKLEYLDVHASKPVTFRFEEEPVISRQAKIHLTKYTDYECTLTEDEIKSMTKFYGVFSNITILSPEVFVLMNSWPSNMFCNATRLTLSMDMPSNVMILLAILELCPVLDVLVLKIQDTEGMEIRDAEMPCQISTWQRVLKKVNIEINCNSNGKTTNSFVKLVEYLLSNSVDLKQFHIKVNWSCYELANEIREMKLCMIVYPGPVLSEGCEVDFVGRFFKMSRKAGLKVWITNGKDIPIN
ncbi:F-box/FBD/LRR-repeat protein At5g22660-like [Silene latifolia]|uniref:F-box/FBD/LRR-repeat protein At5g22660-like n=1 Tax=Silene latifolia TaxID=37657 RepID=UPI003D7868EA